MDLSTSTLLTAALTTAGGGLLVMLAGQGIKKVAGLESAAVIHTLIVALSALAAGAQYVNQMHSHIPPVVLGISGPAIYGVSQLVYRYTNYASSFVGKVQAYNAGQPTPPNNTVSTTLANPGATPPANTETTPSEASF